MKKVIKKKLEETKQHAFEKKVLQREKAKGAPSCLLYTSDAADD